MECSEECVGKRVNLLFDKEFLKQVGEYLKGVEPDTHMIVSMDIDNFRLFNKLFGRESGDKLLAYIAESIQSVVDRVGGVAGYFGADNFALIMPADMELLMKLRSDIINGIVKYGDNIAILPLFGVYSIKDTTEDVENMFDCAAVALKQAKNSQTGRICQYNSNMEERIDEEITLLSEIRDAISRGEFTFYVQPQCDISTGKVVGGESLVRWKHPEKGLVSPGVFIPVLEKTGFIAELDKYVWEQVCKWLREWLDKGYKPVPISINISRIDIFSMDVVEFLKELIQRYNLSPGLIKVEITESAYAESNDKIIKTVKQLRDASFLVMMDDFGSGYSSLNMLNSIAVDVLKLDMRFLDISDSEEERGFGILETVINMARQMKMPVVVEGVETQKQENYLLKMGCRYSQGYYYFKPMPIEDFENIIIDERNVDYNGMWCKQVEQIHVREFLDVNLFNDTMINNILGAAAFYDVYENQVEITRVNEEYYNLAGISTKEAAMNVKKISSHVYDEDRRTLFNLFEQAYENQANGAEGYIHFVRTDGKVLWIHLRVYFLREKEGHKMFYGALTDMTYLKERIKEDVAVQCEVEDLTEKQKHLLIKYYGNMPCGYAVAKVIVDEFGVAYDYDIVYANREMSKISGGDMGRLRQLALKIFDQKSNIFMDKMYRAAYDGEVVEHFTYSSLSGRYLQMTFYQYDYGYVACMLRDATHTHIYQNALDSIVHSYREMYYVQLQDNHIRMIYPDDNHMLDRGNYEEVLNRHFATGRILPYDEANVRGFLSLDNLKNVLRKRDVMEYKYRRNSMGKGEEWCLTSVNVSERENGEPKSAIITVRSIESLMRENEEAKRKQMAEALISMDEGFFAYSASGNQEILYANPQVLHIYGCETIEEFKAYVGGTFEGMIHPDDYKRIESEITEQINSSDKKMDYIRYRIVRKDGEIRWVDDCGHLQDIGLKDGEGQFYVFISDITETLPDNQKERLILLSQRYN